MYAIHTNTSNGFPSLYVNWSTKGTEKWHHHFSFIYSNSSIVDEFTFSRDGKEVQRKRLIILIVCRVLTVHLTKNFSFFLHHRITRKKSDDNTNRTGRISMSTPNEKERMCNDSSVYQDLNTPCLVQVEWIKKKERYLNTLKKCTRYR